MRVTDGIRPFLSRITKSGTGSHHIFPVDTTKLFVIRSVFVVCDEEQIGTHAELRYNVPPYLPIPQFDALKGGQCVVSARHPFVLPPYPTSAIVYLSVKTVKGGTNGFADIGAWIYGTYVIATEN